LQANRRRRTCL